MCRFFLIASPAPRKVHHDQAKSPWARPAAPAERRPKCFAFRPDKLLGSSEEVLSMAGPEQSNAAYLSYAPQDGAKAGEIRELLEDLGVRCILAARGLRGGRGVARELRGEMERARA